MHPDGGWSLERLDARLGAALDAQPQAAACGGRHYHDYQPLPVLPRLFLLPRVVDAAVPARQVAVVCLAAVAVDEAPVALDAGRHRVGAGVPQQLAEHAVHHLRHSVIGARRVGCHAGHRIC